MTNPPAREWHSGYTGRTGPVMEDFTERINRRTIPELKAAGSLKWTGYRDALGAWVAEMDFGVAEPIREALHEYTDSELFGYAPYALELELCRATDQYYSRNFGWSPGQDNVVPTGDVLSGLGAVIDFYTPSGSPVVLPTPAYMPFRDFPRTKGREVIEVPMIQDADGWHMDLAAIACALADNGGLVILCNPHNPVGKMYTRSELRALEGIVARKQATVFADEIHASITFAGRKHIPYASIGPVAAAHTVTATSASKTFNIPGLKCAQLLFSNPQHRQIWRERGFHISHGASNPGRIATIAAYDRGQQWCDQVVSYLEQSRQLLGELLADRVPAVSWNRPDGSYLAWLDVSALDLGRNPQKFMLENAGVALVDGAQCGAGFENFLRLNFAVPQPVLVQMIERIARAVATNSLRDR